MKPAPPGKQGGALKQDKRMKDFQEKLNELKSVMGREDAQSQARFAELAAELKAAPLTDDEQAAFNEWYRTGMDELGQELDRIERKATIREQMEGTMQLIPISYIAKHYFGKSASWLYQRINGNKVRGRSYTLNDEQKATFNEALQDIAKQISSFSIA